MRHSVVRAVVWATVAITAVGAVATAVRWAVDPAAPSTSCIAGGGTTTEAIVCVALDAVASMALWTVIVTVPLALAVAAITAVLERRRER